MKKNMLLLALLVVGGVVFGQKVPKLLWETTVDRLPYYAPVSYSGEGFMKISESGNTVLFYPDNSKTIQNSAIVKAFDKDGKPMWKNSDFYKNKDGVVFPSSLNDRFSVLNYNFNSQQDSTILFDKDYSYSRGFKGYARQTNDGVFYTDFQDSDRSLIKYDSKGKEQWRYRNSMNTSISPLSVEEPYVGLYFNKDNVTSQLVRLDEKGKELSTSESFIFNNAIYAVTKTGAWMTGNQGYENIEFIRFNNQGKKIAKVSMRNVIPKEAFDSNNTRIRQFGDNNLLLVYLKNNEIFFTRIDTVGNVKTVSSGCILSDAKYFNGYNDVKNLEDKDLMYSIELPEKVTEVIKKHKIGVVRFDTPSLSWQKEIITGAYIFRDRTDAVNQYFFQPDNTFLEITSDTDYTSLKSFKIYDILGNLKWKSDLKFFNYNYRITDDFLYANVNGNLSKVRYSDGKQLWQNGIPYIYNYFNHLKKDKNGNDVIFYQDYDVKSTKYSFKIICFNTDGTTNWAYTFPQNNIIMAHTDFKFHEDKIIISTLEPDGDLYKHTLRKISPCNDLNAISITGNTEACPTETVKLSIQKQDGVSYQWQKDGIDVVNARDGIHDFNESGTYTVIAKDEICQNTITSNNVKITIRNLPSTSISTTKMTPCEGERNLMTVTNTNGTFFQWQKDEKDIPNATASSYDNSGSGRYRVGVRDDKCPQTGYSNILTINAKPLPIATISAETKGILYEPFTVKLSANAGTGLAYQWLKDDALIANETTAFYEAKKTGKYVVKVTKDGCTKTSEPLLISILVPLANSEEVGEETVQVYPNPSNGNFKIILPKSLKGSDIQLFDSFGRQRSLIYTGEQAQAEGLVQGVYFLKVSKNGKIVTSKVVIEAP